MKPCRRRRYTPQLLPPFSVLHLHRLQITTLRMPLPLPLLHFRYQILLTHLLQLLLLFRRYHIFLNQSTGWTLPAPVLRTL